VFHWIKPSMYVTKKESFVQEDDRIEKEDIQGDGCENIAVFLGFL